MVTPIGGRRRGSSSGANASPGPSARTQGTSSKKKKRASPGRPGRSPQNASSHAREAHLESANALSEGIAQLDGFIETLSKLKTGDVDDIAEAGRDWKSIDVVKTVEEVIDGNPKPSLEYTLGVLGAERVPKKLGERLRSQGARAFTVELRNRAIQRKKEAMEERKRLAREAKKPPLAPVREAGKGKGVKGKGGGVEEANDKDEGDEKDKDVKIEVREKEVKQKGDTGETEKERNEGELMPTKKKGEGKEKIKKGKAIEEGMADGKGLEKMKDVVEQPVQRTEDTPKVEQTNKETQDGSKPASHAVQRAPRDLTTEVRPAKMDLEEGNSENVAKTVQNKEDSDAKMVGDVNSVKEPPAGVAEKKSAGEGLDVSMKKEASQKSGNPSALDKADKETRKSAVDMHVKPTELSAKAKTAVVPNAQLPSNSDLSSSHLAAEKASEPSVSKAGEQSRDKPLIPSDEVVNEKSPDTKNIRSNVSEQKTVLHPDNAVGKPEPQVSATSSLPGEGKGGFLAKTAGTVAKGGTKAYGRKSLDAVEEKPGHKPIVNTDFEDQTANDDLHMETMPENEGRTSADKSAEASPSDHHGKASPMKGTKGDKSSPHSKNLQRTMGADSNKRLSSAVEQEIDVNAKNAEGVTDRTEVKSSSATHAVSAKGQPPLPVKACNEENDQDSDSSDAELDMIIDGVIQDASNREKSKSKEREDQLEKSDKSDLADDGDAQENCNLPPASHKDAKAEKIEEEPTETKAEGVAPDEGAGIGKAKVEKGDSTLAQKMGGSSKGEDETSLQDEAIDDNKSADDGRKARVKSMGSPSGKNVKHGDLIERKDEEHRRKLSAKDGGESPKGKDQEIAKVESVSSKDPRPKATTKRGKSDGVKDMEIVPIPRKNKRRKEKPQETFEHLEKDDAIQDEKESLTYTVRPRGYNLGPRGLNKEPKEERRVSKKVRKGADGPGRPGTVAKGSKKDPGETTKARKAKETEKPREPQRRGSRRLSYFREDFIDPGSRKTRLRRESSHLGDPTSLPPDTNPFVIDCYHVWKQINQDKITIPFRKPVLKKDAPGYFDVIKHPMDLSTVLLHLEDKTIKTPQDFYDEMILICTNATTFNDKETDLYSLAVELRTKIRKAVRPILKEWRKSMASGEGEGENAEGSQPRSPSADSSRRSASEKQASSESDSDKSSSSSEAKSTQRTGPRYASRRGGTVGRPSSRGRRRARGRGRGGRGGASRKVASDSDGERDADNTIAVPARTSSRGRGRRGGHVKRSVRDPPAAVKKSKRPRAGGDDERDRKKRRVTARKRWDDD